jgi:hypothetical protein
MSVNEIEFVVASTLLDLGKQPVEKFDFNETYSVPSRITKLPTNQLIFLACICIEYAEQQKEILEQHAANAITYCKRSINEIMLKNPFKTFVKYNNPTNTFYTFDLSQLFSNDKHWLWTVANIMIWTALQRSDNVINQDDANCIYLIMQRTSRAA